MIMSRVTSVARDTTWVCYILVGHVAQRGNNMIA